MLGVAWIDGRLVFPHPTVHIHLLSLGFWPWFLPLLCLTTLGELFPSLQVSTFLLLDLSRPRALQRLGIVAFSTPPGLLHPWLEFGIIPLRSDQLSLGFDSFATPILDIDLWLGSSSLGWVTCVGWLFHLPDSLSLRTKANLLTGLTVLLLGPCWTKLWPLIYWFSFMWFTFSTVIWDLYI